MESASSGASWSNHAIARVIKSSSIEHREGAETGTTVDVVVMILAFENELGRVPPMEEWPGGMMASGYFSVISLSFRSLTRKSDAWEIEVGYSERPRGKSLPGTECFLVEVESVNLEMRLDDPGSEVRLIDGGGRGMC